MIVKNKEYVHLISYLQNNGTEYATEKITNNLTEKEFITDFMNCPSKRIILFYKTLRG